MQRPSSVNLWLTASPRGEAEREDSSVDSSPPRGEAEREDYSVDSFPPRGSGERGILQPLSRFKNDRKRCGKSRTAKKIITAHKIRGNATVMIFPCKLNLF